MHTVTSFHASAVQPDQLGEIMAAYLALERARIFRRLLVKRFGVLAVIVAGVSFLWLSVFVNGKRTQAFSSADAFAGTCVASVRAASRRASEISMVVFIWLASLHDMVIWVNLFQPLPTSQLRRIRWWLTVPAAASAWARASLIAAIRAG